MTNLATDWFHAYRDEIKWTMPIDWGFSASIFEKINDTKIYEMHKIWKIEYGNGSEKGRDLFVNN